MKMRFLLAGIIGTGLFVLTTDALAHGGSGRGAGHSGGSWGGHGRGSWVSNGRGAWAGHGRGAWAGHRGGTWAGHGHGFNHGGRFYGPGFGFFGYGYPGYFPGYPYYPYSSPYDGDPYYGNGYYGETYYGNPYYGNRDPRLSATGSLQAALARRGYYQGPIDGLFGPQTRQAIRSFQAHQGLPITGQVDARLIRALQS